ncbi:SusC/RagA family TonB-linked outer membrane protein [Pedobacter soli]|uniref:TonB-linked outer membrane protein, SusC/RagA family n=1 Tax=Pedobacter soli TaxID=390242 RepID=A0A1G6WJH5_9SPHI|nr:TonB-dependent receptor [Pedobacter soli]SDD65225.1 TonB-linked outer membrane protein, SusC/RagA family [Pedobacter soli]
MKKNLLLLFLLTCIYYAAHAQTKIVSGQVTDAKTKESLIGVTVSVPGTKTGTVTDNQGRFSLSIPDAVKSLTFGYVGYQLQTITLTGKPIEVALLPEQNNLNDVVVVGYGTQKKKDLTGAIATVSGSELSGRQTLQVSEALQGAVPGVSVTRNNSAPGAGATVQIRGVTTLNTNSPLVVVDGIPVSSMDLVNPNDIESLSVLKDAASAAIYGSRGAAGVILITTKRGATGVSTVDYNFEYAQQRPNALPEYVDGLKYMKYINELNANDGTAMPYSNDIINNYEKRLVETPDVFPYANTNWQDLIMTNKYAPRKQHDLVFTSGTEKLKTKVSLGYQDVGAFYDNYNYERYQFRVNNDLKISDKFNVIADLSYRRVNALAPVNAPFSGQNPIYESRVIPPVYAAYYSNGAYGIAKDGRNPLAQLQEGGTTANKYNQLQGRIALNFKPIRDLTLTALISPTFNFDKEKSFSKKIVYTSPDGATTGTNRANSLLNESRNESYQLNSQFLANYSKSFNNKHNFAALAGAESIYYNAESLGAGREGFELTDYPYLNVGSILLRTNSGSANEESLHSFFGRVTYDYMSKYYFQANLRHDQSSRFAPEFRKVTYPSFSTGWAISEENFMKPVKWVNYLKLRASYGEVGNQRITDADGNQDYYPYQANVNLDGTALLYQNGVLVAKTTAAQRAFAITNIRWETTTTADIGIDATFFNNRLNLTGGYFNKKTKDILLRLDIPLNLGYDKPTQNAGVLNVKGWELGLNWKDKINEFTYSAGFNIADAKSKILNMGGTVQESGSTVVNMEGSEFNEWYGYLSTGIYQTDAQAASAARTNNNTIKAGDVGYQDLDGNGIINANDRVLLGGSLPRYQYGGNINLGYKGFDFGVVFQGVGKRLTRLGNDIIRPFQEQFGNFPVQLDGKFWSKNNSPEQNAAAEYPKLSNTNSGNNYASSDFWLVNAAYFRVKNATLGYTLSNKEYLKKIGLQSVRFYVSANDFITSSKFPKYADPETGNATYPIVSTFLGGVSVKF